MRQVLIQKQKRPAGCGTWSAYEIGVDEYGTWLFTPQESLYRGEVDGAVGYCNVGSPTGPGIAVLGLIPPTAWWITTFWDEPGQWSATVDICTPPSPQGDLWTYIDLELDVEVMRSGDVFVADEDEFAAAVDAGFIPPDEARAAEAATAAVVQAARASLEPFASVGAARLKDALALHLRPQQTLPPPTSDG